MRGAVTIQPLAFDGPHRNRTHLETAEDMQDSENPVHLSVHHHAIHSQLNQLPDQVRAEAEAVILQYIADLIDRLSRDRAEASSRIDK